MNTTRVSPLHLQSPLSKNWKVPDMKTLLKHNQRGWVTLLLLTMAITGCVRIVNDSQPAPTKTAEATPENQPPASTPDSNIPQTGTYKVKFETTKGDFVVLVHRDWAPIGADRFHQMAKEHVFERAYFFRVVPDFMVQFGLKGENEMSKKWEITLDDDPVKVSNKPGYITFATSGKDSRTTQVFINYKHNEFLDQQGFSPFGEVISGMDVVTNIESKYKEKPDQGTIKAQGNSYLEANFPGLDMIKKVTVFDEEASPAAATAPASTSTPATDTKPEADKKETEQKESAPVEMKKEEAPVEKPIEPKPTETKTPEVKTPEPTPEAKTPETKAPEATTPMKEPESKPAEGKPEEKPAEKPAEKAAGN
jgi:cyclophilin family peptidyl-prolyl cis-trans isomerase